MNSALKDEKGQTSTEMLMLLAGAVVVAFIVGLFLKSIVTNQIQPVAHNALNRTINAVE